MILHSSVYLRSPLRPQKVHNPRRFLRADHHFAAHFVFEFTFQDRYQPRNDHLLVPYLSQYPLGFDRLGDRLARQLVIGVGIQHSQPAGFYSGDVGGYLAILHLTLDGEVRQGKVGGNQHR